MKLITGIKIEKEHAHFMNVYLPWMLESPIFTNSKPYPPAIKLLKKNPQIYCSQYRTLYIKEMK